MITPPMAGLCIVLALTTIAAVADPAAEDTAVRRFHARDYGALPGAYADAGPGIGAAIAAAIDCGQPAEVVLEAGTYRLGRPPAGDHAVRIANARDLTIRGSDPGTELIITDPETGGFSLSGCLRTTVRNLTLDYDPPPFAQGTITAVDLDAQTYDLQVDEGFIEPDHAAFQNAKAVWGLVVRPLEGTGDTRFGPTAIPAVIDSKIGPRHWRMKIGGPPTGYPEPLRNSGMKPGDRFVHAARNYTAAFGASHCDDLIFENLTLHSSPGLAFLPYLCGKVTIRNCHVLRREGSGRMLSTNADGVHCRGCRKGITIDGCSFEGMADDGINIHSSAIPVLEVISPAELVLQRSHYTLLVGDLLEGMDVDTASVLGQARVLSVAELPDRWAYRVALDAPIDGLRAGASVEDADCLYNLSESGTGSVITDCHFRCFRGRGILLSATGVRVSGNLFEVMEGWGISLNHESTRWAEGPLARDIEIIGNTFNGKGGYMPAIFLYSQQRDGKLSSARAIHNLLIQGNLFRDLGTPAIELRACRGVRIIDNRIETGEDTRRPRAKYDSILVDNCAEVAIRGLKVRDLDPRHLSAIAITAATDPGDAGVVIEGLDTEIALSSTPVRDQRGE
ncbi:MAG: hypothetical protein HPY44_03400 [Armatimonadetes bacterium]|nr:hypothetical protein [Armatimonadota bacterium]